MTTPRNNMERVHGRKERSIHARCCDSFGSASLPLAICSGCSLVDECDGPSVACDKKRRCHVRFPSRRPSMYIPTSLCDFAISFLWVSLRKSRAKPRARRPIALGSIPLAVCRIAPSSTTPSPVALLRQGPTSHPSAPFGASPQN